MIFVKRISVMIAASMNVSNAIKSSARSVVKQANLATRVSTVINAIAGDAMTMKKLMLFSYGAVDAMLNLAMIAGSEGIDRDNCIAQHVSIIV